MRQIGRAVRQSGGESTVFTLSPDPHPAELSMPENRVVRRRSWWAPASCDLGGPAAFATFRALAREADVVHFHYPWPFGDLLHLLAGVDRPAVVHYHSDIVRQGSLERLYAPLRAWHLARADAVIATSPAYVRTSPLLAGLARPARIAMIPLGMGDLTADAPAAQAVPAHPDADVPYFLFIGALRYYKGLDYLIDAAARAGARVLVAGAGPDLPRLRERAQAAGATGVRFLGLVDDATKLALLRGAMALVLPSHLRSEAFGMVLVEAAMFGRPMISCEIGTGTSFVNLDGVTGKVVPPADVEALAAAMRELAGDAALRERLGAGARARYVAEFDARVLGRRLLRLYENILRGRPVSEGLESLESQPNH